MDKKIIERSKNSIILYVFLATMLGFFIFINIIKLIKNASGPLSVITTIPLLAIFVFSIIEIKWELKNPYILFEDNSMTIYRNVFFAPITFDVAQISEVEKREDTFYEITLKDERVYLIGLSNAAGTSKNLLNSILNRIENSLNTPNL